MIKRCIGCGSILQSSNKDELGYIPKEKIDKQKCMRCFRLEHYHEVPKKEEKATFVKIKNGLTFFICDILNFSKETFAYYEKIPNPKYFVVSKLDLFPKNLKKEKVLVWLKANFNILNVLFVSSKKNYGLDPILSIIDNSNDKNVTFCGPSNSGKSSLLNALFSKDITVSDLINTTLDNISFSYKDKTIYDTAGFINTYMTKQTKYPIKEVTMPLKENASVLVDNLFRIKALNKNSITFYIPYYVPKKVYDNNDTFLNEDKVLLNDVKEKIIWIKGICFCYVKNGGELLLYHVKKEDIMISDSFWKGSSYE